MSQFQATVRRHYSRFVELRALAETCNDPIVAISEIPLRTIDNLNALEADLPTSKHPDPVIHELHIATLSLCLDAVMSATRFIAQEQGFKSMTSAELKETGDAIKESLVLMAELRQEHETHLRALNSGIQLADIAPTYIPFTTKKLRFS